MGIELTEEQSKAIEQLGITPPRVTDPRTHKTYVLLSSDIFEKIKTLVGDLDPREAYVAVDRAFAPGWNDPKMADYDHYEDLKR